MKRERETVTEKLLWSATGTIVGVVAGAVSLRVARVVWGLAGKGPPPSAPESSRTRWRDALLWSGLSGLAGGLVTVTLRRLAAKGWARYRTHHRS